MSDYDDYDDYDYRYRDDYYYFKCDEKQVKRDFMNYADPKTKKIDSDGYEKMGKTLGIDIYTDIFITYFIYKCGAKKLDYITESEYIEGMKAFKCNNLGDIRSKMINIRGELLEIHSNDFRNFYNFLFDINVGGDQIKRKEKYLPMDEVEIYFKSLFCEQFPIVGEFLTYLKETNKNGLKWDEWRTFLDFVQAQGLSFPKDYNMAEYFPILIDEFYKWYCNKKGIKIKDPNQEEEEED